MRAVRYARRLDFSIAPDTRHLITTALAEGVFDRLSGQRLRRELELLLTEAHPTEALALVARLGLLPAICPDLEWSETIRGQLMEVEGQLAWYELEGLGPAPELWILFLAGLAVQPGADTVAHLAERLQLGGSVRDRVLALPHQVETIVQAADPSLPRSQRSRVIENCAPEALLLAMAEVPLEARRVLADAAEAAVRLELPVTGQQLLDHDVPPGPHIGRALTMARDALVDGVVSADEVLSWAVATAAGLKEEGS